MPQPSLELIRGVPLFAEADERFLERLAGEFMERRYAAGDTIAQEGEAGRTFFVIESGEATVTVHGQVVARLGPGAAFGEMALIDKSARSATVKAETPSGLPAPRVELPSRRRKPPRDGLGAPRGPGNACPRRGGAYCAGLSPPSGKACEIHG